MQIPVLIEPVAANGFRASSGEPLPLTAEGATREEALTRLRQLLESKLQNGCQLTTLEVGPQEHPFDRFVGIWKPDDPEIAAWREAVEEYRRQKDEEEQAR